MHRLIKLLFWISDILAWLLVAIALFTAVTYPIVGPITAAMAHQRLAPSSIVIGCLLWLSVALGAYLITRRYASGIALIVALFFVFFAFPSGEWLASLFIAGTLALVFGLPFLLVMIESHTHASSSAP